jgi:hypothetical protein
VASDPIRTWREWRADPDRATWHEWRQAIEESGDALAAALEAAETEKAHLTPSMPTTGAPRRPRAWIALVGALAVLALAGGAAAPERPPSADQLRAQLARERAQHEAQAALYRRVIRRARARTVRLTRVLSRAPALTPAEAHLRAIEACESGGDPRAVSPGGLYRGALQFDGPTWRSVGGRGYPAAATLTEQRWRGLLLYLRRGAQPWPVCGAL